MKTLELESTLLKVDACVTAQDFDQALRLIEAYPACCTEVFPPGHPSTRHSDNFPGGTPGMVLMHGVCTKYHQVSDVL